MQEIGIISLSDIKFPIYKLPEKPMEESGVVLYCAETFDEEYGEMVSKVHYKIVDDKSIPNPSLGIRRLALKEQGVPLYKLSKAIVFLGDMIKLANGTTWFIDSNGKVFNYQKSQRAKLNFYRIEQVIPINTGGAIITLFDCPTRFKTLGYPDKGQAWAGVLHYGMSMILYGLYDKEYKSTWRTI